jgi:hypothetical protein
VGDHDHEGVAVHRPLYLSASAAAVLALVVIASTACGGGRVSPLDADPPRPSIPTSLPAPTPSATPTPPPPRINPPRRTTATRTSAPTGPPACGDAEIYTLPADAELALVRSLCLGVGSILRIEGAAADSVSVDLPDNVSSSYEAGVVEIRFLYEGTVVVSINRDEQTYPIAVVVRS